VVIPASFTERLTATPSATVRANCSSAVNALSHGTIAAWCSHIAVTSHVLDLAVGIHRSRGLVQSLQLNKQFADTLTSRFKLLKFRGSWVALLKQLSLSSY
jgi:spore coat protein U-like protein